MKKILCASMAVLLAAGCSAGTSGSTATNGSTTTSSEDAYYVFTADVQTLDWQMSQNASDAQITTNLVDGLTETNSYNNYVGALAESWESNDDKTVWTFHLRDAKWVTNTGEEYADVTADDFVTALRHLSDFQGPTLSIAEAYVDGLSAYGKSDKSDAEWEKVGVKAVDDKTVEYTLSNPTPYFYTVVANNSFWPVNREFLESQGDGCKLGSPDNTDCGYGNTSDPSSILYNGAYILDELVSKSSQKMHKNESYWDAEHVYVENVTRVYDDGSDPASTVKGFEYDENPYYQATLLTSAKDFDSYLEQYADYAYNPLQNGYTFGINFNLNRTNFDNSSKTTAQQADTKKALLNTHFRRAIKFGLDRVAYMSTVMDKSIAEKVIRSIECPWNFVSTSDGSSYGELVQAASEDSSIDLSEGQDSTYDPAKAKEEMEAAVKELKAEGVSFPIVVDLLTDDASASLPLQAASLEQSIEESIGTDYIDIVVHSVSDDDYMASSYTATGPQDCCWDISTSTGWGADYVDPKTYLNIFSPVDGDVTNNSMALNFYQSNEYDDDQDNKDNDAAIEESGLLEYQSMLEEAYAITDDMDARYEAEAKAEAYLLDNALFIPIQSQTSSVNYTISRVTPFSGAYQSSKFKGMVINKDAITKEEYDAAYETWQKEKVEDNKVDHSTGE